ncbi:NAD(P)/FAD-dependent oxidoreductase [Helicobacter mustelae]|uniref:Putative pyridine nucleotide-disulphide oxidoreductase n=1 Tax=Helicobacter mustelae (strain ATCC 43772 / CCUG 25715 / CIP 103759 / LMG 18044 / NCTC 12198 / R85-136P) TaxID=679897 RepID=D3UG23_HELM1|nr:NAD(P)/FAD-dependent oxidoreductase [Helicobacter mustelae]CBG39444.1 putative pyridine nucleotide-disulphide oxidoreductase [Helicobacter mustelae 12198]SQH70956.1 pyridine nucleotide-disulphide oxidoreductase [Helicobacter mustelae]STP12082.1 pyridine nucleotide-disulphide oxidoreductase [Helicobacter mustelae]
MKKIVVLGAGYGSLAFLKSLDQTGLDAYEVVLISKQDYHYTSILLHEVASGARVDVRYHLSEILPRNIITIKDTVVRIEENEVIGEKKHYAYDYLIIGLGFQSDTFGIPGIKEFTTPIIDFEGALALREQIYAQIRKYKTSKDPLDLKFVICGGGFSGIETIASLAINLKKECQNHGVDPSLLDLICIEAMPEILPMFPQTLVQDAKNYLQTLGVKLATGCKILRCEQNKVVVERTEGESKIEDGFEAGVIIWTAGVKGNGVVENSPFFTSGRSKIEVDAYLQPTNQEHQEKMHNIYVLGDCAALKDPSSGRFYPPTAQIAMKQGEYLAQAFRNRILGSGGVQGFAYKSEGTICSLGEHYAIGIVGSREFKGKMAIYLKRMIEKKWIFKILGYFKGLFR